MRNTLSKSEMMSRAVGSDSQWEQLMELKDLTSRLNILHEAQILQIKMWGFLALDDVLPSKIVIKINIENREIIYEYPKSKRTYKKTIKILQDRIHLLLGNNWSVNTIGY